MIKVSAPGRICILGEHQDYFGLSVISAAINMRIEIEGYRNNHDFFKLELPDIGEKETINLSGDFSPQKERDYLRSSLRVLTRYGYRFSNGYNCVMKSNIPIGKGVSSSSAMVVCWLKFLLTITDSPKKVTREELAELAYEAEVKEFNEPGGMQDHYCSSLGGLLYIDCKEKTVATQLKTKFRGFVLGDSLVRKDTKRVLSRIKNNVNFAVEKVREEIKDFSLEKTELLKIRELLKRLPEEPGLKLEATLMTRDLTREAKKFIERGDIDDSVFGSWLDRHHSILRDGLQISTERIEKLIDAAKSAGALGCKINGSGGGGCFLAFAPGKENLVLEAIEKAGGKGYLVGIDKGVYIEGEKDASSWY